MSAVSLSKAYTPADVERLEGAFLGMDQAACSVTHRFGPGIYIRELAVNAGAYVIGHSHRHAHMNALVSGRVSIFLEDGSQTELTGPTTFVAPPGRKMAYVHEDMIWQNIYATPLTDVAELEAELFEPSPTFKSVPMLSWADHAEDVKDFLDAITAAGFTPDQVRAISENTADQRAFPFGEYKVMVAPSQIEGRGLFATGDIARLEPIAPALLDGLRTPAGRYTNHAKIPNAIMGRMGNDIYLFALRDIAGSRGGMIGEEITVDYRETLGGC